MTSNKHRPGINHVGHTPQGPGAPSMSTAWTAFGQDGLVNHQGWVIDFFHVATGKCVNFKAYITGFSDSFTSNWTEEQVYGRMDPISMYAGTSRSIDFSFSVPAESAKDAKKNMHKFEHLSTMLYPTYKVAGGINTLNAAPLLKIKFTNLITNVVSEGKGTSAFQNGLLGYVDGISMDPDIELGWFAPTPGMLYPKAFDLNLKFTVLHTHDLGFKEGTDNGKWLGDPDQNPDNSKAKNGPGFPYGIHSITGKHSICPGKGAAPTHGGGAKNSNVGKAKQARVLR